MPQQQPYAGSRRRSDNDFKRACTVYVSGIDAQTTEAYLRDFFALCGKVDAVRLCGDNDHPTRFAFIQFSAPECAAYAISLSGINVGQRSVRISTSKTHINTPSSSTPMTDEALNKVGRTVYVGNLDPVIDKEKLTLFFGACGTVTAMSMAGSVDNPKGRFAFLEFASSDEARLAIHMDGTTVGGRPIRVSPSKTPIYKPSGEALAIAAADEEPASKKRGRDGDDETNDDADTSANGDESASKKQKKEDDEAAAEGDAAAN
eukprot:TRINITY_DN236_c0_g2_i3.p3 TRINITY_DN236_c0_g2~~TRINITY_DN236_c0_g2_i3.p3  ORF type:complete len:301 (-),score=93.68 TRINITY_DN236_c0_g2_i3:1226-2008(-)